jgi:hypothetical protein
MGWACRSRPAGNGLNVALGRVFLLMSDNSILGGRGRRRVILTLSHGYFCFHKESSRRTRANSPNAGRLIARVKLIL